MHKITPFLWFDGNAEEAAKFYTSIFKNSKIGETRRYAEGGPAPKGSAMSVAVTLDGQELTLFNGGPHFTFTPAISLFVDCENQAEVDAYWNKLLDGGKESRCGWLTDKYGLSWQIVPRILGELLQDKDAAKSRRVMEAMMKMIKLDAKALQAAYDAA